MELVNASEDSCTKQYHSPDRERAIRAKMCWSIDFDDRPLLRDIQLPETFANIQIDVKQSGRGRGRGHRAREKATDYLLTHNNIAYDLRKVNGTAHQIDAIKFQTPKLKSFDEEQFEDHKSKDEDKVELEKEEVKDNNPKFRPILDLSNVVMTRHESGDGHIPFSFTIDSQRNSKLKLADFITLESPQASPTRKARKGRKKSRK